MDEMTLEEKIYGDFDDDLDDDDSYSPDEDEECCGECDDVAVDECQCCGKPLCVMHSEIGAGFCKDCPTKDYKPEYEEK